MGGIQGTNANSIQDQEELWDRFKELHEKIDTLMLTRDAIEQQIEEIRIDDRSLEDRIKANLLGRKLNLSELSEYCKEDSTIVLKCLKQMQEAKDVKQDQRLRWYLLD
jgi:chaperonin cofactor prefoldin